MEEEVNLTTSSEGLEVILGEDGTSSPGATLEPPSLCRYHLRILHKYMERNISLDPGNSTAVLVAFSSHGGTQYQWFEIVIPIICFLGIVGNILNLLVTKKMTLSRKKRKLNR